MNYLLIGRPNVGKSSIFNIVTQSNDNIIHKEEGTTRDWHFNNLYGVNNYYIYDTPGILINDKINNDILNIKFLKSLINKIDKFIYVVDYNSLTDEIDKFAISKLRKFDKDIILIFNKFDNLKIQPDLEINKFGIENYFFISCSHNSGFDKLKKYMDLPSKTKLNKNKIDFSIAIFGKPNCGKSTLLNSFLGYERAATSHIAGTTSEYVFDFFSF